MISITQDIKFRLPILHFAAKYGITKTAVRYLTNRQFIYRLIWSYGSTAQSLAPKSRRPHHHSNEHTPQEVRLISNMRRRNLMMALSFFGSSSSFAAAGVLFPGCIASFAVTVWLLLAPKS